MNYSVVSMTRSGDGGQTPPFKRERITHDITTASARVRLDDMTDTKVVRCEGHDGQSLGQETGLLLLPYFWF